MKIEMGATKDTLLILANAYVRDKTKQEAFDYFDNHIVCTTKYQILVDAVKYWRKQIEEEHGIRFIDPTKVEIIDEEKAVKFKMEWWV